MKSKNEKYASMQLPELKKLIKERGIKGTSTMRKPQLIEVLVSFDAAHATESDTDAVAKPEEKAPAKEKAPVNEAAATKKRGRPKKSEESTPHQDSTAGNTSDAEEHTEERGSQKRPYHRRDQQNGRSYQYNGNGNGGHRGRIQKNRGNSTDRRQYNNNSQYNRHSQNQTTYQNHEESGNTQSDTSQTSYQKNNEIKEQPGEENEIPHYADAKPCQGMLEIMQDGYGFLRSGGYLPGENDVYVSQSQIRRFRLRTGDIVTGQTRRNNPNDKYGALLFIESVNGINPDACTRRTPFEKLTPIFPNERIRLERPGGSVAVRIMDVISPIGKGQRGMIVSPPKAGKTTLLKQVAMSVMRNNPEIHLIILLIDERPEEVTDMKETVDSFGGHCEVLASTFDEMPENHKRLSEMVIEHAKRRVELGQDVMILLDSITRLARAYNLTVPPSGRTLSGGLDPAALHMPKRFFGAARNMKEGGSLTILATALIDTGSRMDDVVYEEFKGTGNMELVLDRSLSEKRVFPAIDLARSSTRRDDLLYNQDERLIAEKLRRDLSGLKSEEAAETIIATISGTSTNAEFISKVMSTL